ncbi:transposase (fragment) [Xenorhabdus szentirmaii DSM 16338]|uniref:Transposase n=1 Tax=Xenorhabdus szentirmaii DSM 16338 TaxID=1427518 RepID=W1IZY1_9GAMM
MWWQGPAYRRADHIVDSLTPPQWEPHSAGRGAKGERQYDWVLVPLWRLQRSEKDREYGHYLLVRRRRDEKQARAY